MGVGLAFLWACSRVARPRRCPRNRSLVRLSACARLQFECTIRFGRRINLQTPFRFYDGHIRDLRTEGSYLVSSRTRDRIEFGSEFELRCRTGMPLIEKDRRNSVFFHGVRCTLRPVLLRTAAKRRHLSNISVHCSHSCQWTMAGSPPNANSHSQLIRRWNRHDGKASLQRRRVLTCFDLCSQLIYFSRPKKTLANSTGWTTRRSKQRSQAYLLRHENSRELLQVLQRSQEGRS